MDVDILYEKYNIENYGTREEPLFKAKDIGKLLDIKDIRTTMRDFDKDDVRNMVLMDTINRKQKMLMLTKKGFFKLLNITRKPKAIEICKQLNHKNINPEYFNHCKESIFIKNILEAFDGEIIIEQFQVLNFKIDLYFPKYKLAIEFYEKYHNKQKETDLLRIKEIKKELNCEFIIINEKYNFNIVFNNIFKHIKKYIEK